VKNLINLNWLWRTSNFWVGGALYLMTVFYLSTAATAGSKSVKTTVEIAQPTPVPKSLTATADVQKEQIPTVLPENTPKPEIVVTPATQNPEPQTISLEKAIPTPQRWIEVNLAKQRLIAREGEKTIYTIPISSGKQKTPTKEGTFTVQRKLRTSRMKGKDYDISDVPYTMYYSGSYAIHGAYWRNKFGRRASHGCVNLPVTQAKKLYSWAGVGTKIVIH
jgi:lipoprotein-anchoring transpeptidase ErfK/SrfK